MSSYKHTFVMKMMTADDREVTVGRSIYWQNKNYPQPTRPLLNLCSVITISCSIVTALLFREITITAVGIDLYTYMN
jgi:hypothetical protein